MTDVASVVPRLGKAFASMTAPVTLVLDDVHLLRNSECRSGLSVLADHVPEGSRLALAGRAEPPLRVARLRTEGKIVEIGPADLSLTRTEASSLLRAAEVTLDGDEVAELHRRTEGWAAALYLAALYLREGDPLEDAVVSFGGGDRLVSEYVESEFLARISARQRTFLTRTAVLERMSGPLCEAVLELIRVYLALADLAGARTLMREIDDLLRRRPALGTLAAQADELRDRLAPAHGSAAPGASALTGAELRLLPMLSTHLSFAEIAAQLSLSRNTVSSQAMSVYRKLAVGSRSQAVERSRELGLRDDAPFHVICVMTLAPARDVMVLDGERRSMNQTARFQKTLCKLAIIDEGFVKDEAGLTLGPAATSALDPKTATLLQVGASVTIGSSSICLQWSVSRAIAAGATEDEIADVLLAIAPVAGLGRIAAAAPDVAIALGYDVSAALEELDPFV